MKTTRAKIIFTLLVLFASVSFSQDNKFIDSLKNVLATTKVDTVRVMTLLEMSEEYTYSDKTESFAYARKALKLSEKIKHENGIASSLSRLGVLYINVAKPDSALYVLEKAKTIFVKSKKKPRIAAVENNIGMAWYDKINYEKALTNYLSALKIGEELNDHSIMTSTLNNIANLYYEQKDLKKALEFHRKSLALARESKNTFKIASSLNNMGIIYREKGETEKAIEAFSESLGLAKQMGNKMGIALLLGNIGAAYSQAGDLDMALQFFNDALPIKQEIGDKRGEANCYMSISDIDLKRLQYDKAIDNAQKSIEIAKQIGSNNIRYNSYDILSKAFAAKKQFQKAYEFHNLYVMYKDSVFDLEKSELIADINSKYETEKKDKEIEFLNKDKDLQDATIKMQGAEAKRQSVIRTGMLIGISMMALLAIFIYRSYRIKHRSNKELSEKNEVIHDQKLSLEEKQKEILDSIHYAKRIQDTLMSHGDFINKILPDNFIYFKPKDIVSGDFYWVTEKNNNFYMAVCDSTGHGVPGAFMSLLNINFLNEAINEKNITEPGKILDYIRECLIASVGKDGQKDGFDGALLCFNKTDKTLSFSAANNSPILVKDGTYHKLEANRMPVGRGERSVAFSTQTIEVNKGDTLYLYTDGFADQFGGPRGKKFKSRPLNELLARLSSNSMKEQSKELDETFGKWKGKLDQVDDVCIVGIRF